ncbi:hypothetical protein EJ08DRAFT_735651 [Tothia fuscella]|uniref:Zinc finger PHD-type domain-containing protein n=1 Tax=Tothia fuscella TaxID=1048955 RepID=A0A9P4NMZ1_9PEZI|nr:hypothetical protein EJ08DRAFT_735651 [Tothia fuscella]
MAGPSKSGKRNTLAKKPAENPAPMPASGKQSAEQRNTLAKRPVDFLAKRPADLLAKRPNDYVAPSPAPGKNFSNKTAAKKRPADGDAPNPAPEKKPRVNNAAESKPKKKTARRRSRFTKKKPQPQPIINDLTRLKNAAAWMKSHDNLSDWLKYPDPLQRFVEPPESDPKREMFLTHTKNLEDTEIAFQIIAASGMPVEKAVPNEKEYHAFHVVTPREAPEEGGAEAHPEKENLLERLDAKHYKALFGYFTEDMDFVGRRYELVTVCPTPYSDQNPNTIKVLWIFKTQLIEGNLVDSRQRWQPELGPPYWHYQGSVPRDLSEWHWNPVAEAAKDIMTEYNWTYNLESFHCKTFAVELIERVKADDQIARCNRLELPKGVEDQSDEGDNSEDGSDKEDSDVDVGNDHEDENIQDEDEEQDEEPENEEPADEEPEDEEPEDEEPIDQEPEDEEAEEEEEDVEMAEDEPEDDAEAVDADVEMDDSNEVIRVNKDKAKPEAKYDLWCHCNGPDIGTMMVKCADDGCLTKWFHAKCVGLTAETIPEGAWICPLCRPRTPKEQHYPYEQNSLRVLRITTIKAQRVVSRSR